MFTVSHATFRQFVTRLSKQRPSSNPTPVHVRLMGKRIEIMTSSTRLHATKYNDAWQTLGLVWVVTITGLTASSYSQYFYSRPVTGMHRMLYKLQKKESGVRSPTVFRVQGPKVMAHQADNTVLTFGPGIGHLNSSTSFM